MSHKNFFGKIKKISAVLLLLEFIFLGMVTLIFSALALNQVQAQDSSAQTAGTECYLVPKTENGETYAEIYMNGVDIKPNSAISATVNIKNDNLNISGKDIVAGPHFSGNLAASVKDDGKVIIGGAVPNNLKSNGQAILLAKIPLKDSNGQSISGVSADNLGDYLLMDSGAVKIVKANGNSSPSETTPKVVSPQPTPQSDSELKKSLGKSSSGNGLEYRLQVPLLGVTKVDSGKVMSYFVKLYKFGVYVTIAFAFLGLVYGAFVYMISGGNSGMKQHGRDYMWGAVWGLLIVFGSWALLKIINPELVKFKLAELSGIKYEVNNNKSNKNWQTVSYTLQCKCLGGCAQISKHLPSNQRYIPSPGSCTGLPLPNCKNICQDHQMLMDLYSPNKSISSATGTECCTYQHLVSDQPK